MEYRNEKLETILKNVQNLIEEDRENFFKRLVDLGWQRFVLIAKYEGTDRNVKGFRKVYYLPGEIDISWMGDLDFVYDDEGQSEDFGRFEDYLRYAISCYWEE